jgi:hypothetical protein
MFLFPEDSEVEESLYPRYIVPIISPADADSGAYRPAFSVICRKRRGVRNDAKLSG